jgi:hypothetical protein
LTRRDFEALIPCDHGAVIHRLNHTAVHHTQMICLAKFGHLRLPGIAVEVDATAQRPISQLSNKQRAQFDPFFVRRARSGDRMSPTECARSLLGKRLCALLADGSRQVIGTFAFLGKPGEVVLTNATHIDRLGRTKELGTAVIPISWMQRLEYRPEA